MKHLTALLALIFVPISIYAQNLTGAWEAKSTLDNGIAIKHLMIFSDNYFVMSAYKADDSEFVSTKGGFYSFDNGKFKQNIEFNTATPDQVGNEFTVSVESKNGKLTFKDSGLEFTQLDNGQPGELAAAWIFAGRKSEDGTMNLRTGEHSRKTMKVLSGTKFQWIAFDVETKQFMGTGGGTYTTANGKYTETIEFFSRDVTRVGHQLEFDFEIINDQWHHSGLSSKGDPIYEIWAKRN